MSQLQGTWRAKYAHSFIMLAPQISVSCWRIGARLLLYINIKGWGCACTAVFKVQQLTATTVCYIKLHTAVPTSSQLESTSRLCSLHFLGTLSSFFKISLIKDYDSARLKQYCMSNIIPASCSLGSKHDMHTSSASIESKGTTHAQRINNPDIPYIACNTQHSIYT